MYGTKKLLIIAFCFKIFFCGYAIATDPAIATETIANLANCGGSAVPDAAKKVVDESLDAGVALDALKDPFMEIFGVFCTVDHMIFLAKEAGRAGCAIKSYIKPSAKEKFDALKVKEKYKYLLARKTFKECLAKNVRGQRNSYGRPEECEELARMFAMVGGDEEIENMTGIFKKVGRKQAISVENVFCMQD